jgi:PIN domain nuclease of toxin-antitoxin system
VNSHTFYVTDTHSLLWYLYDIPRLSPNARAAFDTVDGGDGTLAQAYGAPLITHDEVIHQAGVVQCVW